MQNCIFNSTPDSISAMSYSLENYSRPSNDIFLRNLWRRTNALGHYEDEQTPVAFFSTCCGRTIMPVVYRKFRMSLKRHTWKLAQVAPQLLMWASTNVLSRSLYSSRAMKIYVSRRKNIFAATLGVDRLHQSKNSLGSSRISASVVLQRTSNFSLKCFFFFFDLILYCNLKLSRTLAWLWSSALWGKSKLNNISTMFWPLANTIPVYYSDLKSFLIQKEVLFVRYTSEKT